MKRLWPGIQSNEPFDGRSLTAILFWSWCNWRQSVTVCNFCFFQYMHWQWKWSFKSTRSSLLYNVLPNLEEFMLCPKCDWMCTKLLWNEIKIDYIWISWNCIINEIERLYFLLDYHTPILFRVLEPSFQVSPVSEMLWSSSRSLHQLWTGVGKCLPMVRHCQKKPCCLLFLLVQHCCCCSQAYLTPNFLIKVTTCALMSLVTLTTSQ